MLWLQRVQNSKVPFRSQHPLTISAVTHPHSPVLFFSWKQKHDRDITACLWGHYLHESTKSRTGGNYLDLCYCSAISWQPVDSAQNTSAGSGLAVTGLSSPQTQDAGSQHTQSVCPWRWTPPLLMCELNNQTLSRHPSSNGGGMRSTLKSAREPVLWRHSTDTHAEISMKFTVQLLCLWIAEEQNWLSSLYSLD